MTVEQAGEEEIQSAPLVRLTDLMGSIHQDPELRDWVTPGSVCLVPVASADDLGWTVHALVAEGAAGAVESDGGVDVGGLGRPSALVSWSWPTGTVVERRHLNPSEVPSEVPAEATTPPPDYLDALEDLLAGPPDPSGSDAARDLAQQMLSDGLRRAYVSVAAATIDPFSDHIEIPKPLVVYLDAWIGDTMGLARQHSAQQTSRSLQALRTKRVQPGFRVAFVGSFGSGKSRLLNQLIGRDLLPTESGVVLHHAVPVVGALPGDERLETSTTGGRLAGRPLEPESWADLIDDGSAVGAPCRVKAHVHNQWLRTNDIELVDTPGYCLTSPSQAALIERVVADADAVVICVDANSAALAPSGAAGGSGGARPLGRSDAMFIDDVKSAPHAPPIAVVVTTSDDGSGSGSGLEVTDDDLTALRDTLAAMGLGATGVGTGIRPDLDLDLVGAPRTTVLRGPRSDTIDEDHDEVEDLRELIERWALSGERRRKRDIDIADQLLGEIAGLRNFAAAGLDATRLKEEARHDRRAALDEQIWAAVPVWKEMEELLGTRRQELMSSVGAQLAAAGTTAAQRVFAELDASDSPRRYWAEDLPSAIRRELVDAVDSIDRTVRAGLAADLDSFDNVLLQQFRARGVPAPGGVAADPDQPERADLIRSSPEGTVDVELSDDLDDLTDPTEGGGTSGFATSQRVAPAVAPVLSPLAILLRGALTGAVGRLGLSSEVFLGDQVLTTPMLASEQSKIRPHLQALIGEAVDALARATGDEMRRFHTHLLFDAKRRQQRWLAHQRRALDQAGRNGTDTWHRLADACDHLATRISRSVADEESKALHSGSKW